MRRAIAIMSPPPMAFIPLCQRRDPKKKIPINEVIKRKILGSKYGVFHHKYQPNTDEGTAKRERYHVDNGTVLSCKS